jgi:hypothetical protein
MRPMKAVSMAERVDVRGGSAGLFAEAHIGGAGREESEGEPDSDEVVHDASTLPPTVSAA